MGITIVQKSDLNHPKPESKVALVLSGGGISGGAFKIGGLNALSSFMANRQLRDFDMFVGVSAGAVIATYLANGVSSKDLASSLEGAPGKLNPIKAWDLYAPNLMAFLQIPTHVIGHMVSIVPKRLRDIMGYKNIFREDFRNRLMQTVFKPTYKNVGDFLAYCLKEGDPNIQHPTWPWHYLPNGIFTTEKFEQANRKNPDFKGDIILVEPSEYDDKFFDMNPMSFRERRVAAKRGYDSVRQSIADDYEILKKILATYGIKTNPKFKTAPVEETPSMIATCPEPMAA